MVINNKSSGYWSVLKQEKEMGERNRVDSLLLKCDCKFVLFVVIAERDH